MALNRKTVLLISSELPPLPGGIGNHAHLLAKYLQKAGYEVCCLSDFRAINQDLKFDAAQSYSVYRVKRNHYTYANRLRKAWKLAQSREVIMASGKFSLWVGAFLKWWYPNKKYIAILHGTEIKAGNKPTQALTQWSLKQYQHIIAVSNYTKQQALALNPKLSIEVINNGIELPSATAAKVLKSDQPLHLITVGNVTQRKGQHLAIQMLPLLKETLGTVHYHCVGIPTEQQRLEVFAKELGVEKEVTFYGALDEVQKINLLQQSAIFLMLSTTVKNDFEGFGIAILEANALGIPAIGSVHSGIADAIQHGVSGFLVDPDQPEQVVAAIQEIIKNYDTFSKQSKDWVNNFDWNTVVTRYRKVVEE